MFKWFPWRFIIRQVARRNRFLDPFKIMARVKNLAQPSEIAAPLELVRAGFAFHARGFVNSQAVQHNLDWIWPYWIERQYDPNDPAFIPRAFNITHTNLTHRNWTALGLPDSSELPLVDPRGLVTPFFDGWSLDTWFIPRSGRSLLPSRQESADQQLGFDPYSVLTRCSDAHSKLTSRAQVEKDSKDHYCVLDVEVQSELEGSLVISVRPYNPEGISFIDSAELAHNRKSLRINGTDLIELSEVPGRVLMDTYEEGDVFAALQYVNGMTDRKRNDSSMKCSAGMGTVAAAWPLDKNGQRLVRLKIPLRDDSKSQSSATLSLKHSRPDSWKPVLARTSKLNIPDSRMQFLYDAAVRTLILHSSTDVYPGPYTYKRFWFRDAAFILNALISIGLAEHVKPIIEQFPQKQTALGYFLSQEGEWDANGEALWIIHRYVETTGERVSDKLMKSIVKGGKWISSKRLSKVKDSPHAGLFPAGFSAEHFGPNDYYYWDDFWGVAGLKVSADLLQSNASETQIKRFQDDAESFMSAINDSLDHTRKRLKTEAIPASPYRRMDVGAVGSLVASYPLQLVAADDRRIKETLDYLYENCLVEGALFHDLVHSGINIYLTLHIAQCLLRAGDDRYFGLIEAVADIASATGQWPEAVHPKTKGGCMGDGQHVWAAAEWVMMIRNLFVREEPDGLILCSGIPREWYQKKEELSFGPTWTAFGQVSVKILPDDPIRISWNIEKPGKPAPRITVKVQPDTIRECSSEETSIGISRDEIK